MLRAIVLTVVLTFTTASNCSLLCRMVCQAQAVGNGCHEALPASQARVANDMCGVGSGLMAAVQEVLSRGVSAPDIDHVILPLAGGTPDAARAAYRLSPKWASPPLGQRPPTVLRI